jgi:hypothetical protein
MWFCRLQLSFLVPRNQIGIGFDFWNQNRVLAFSKTGFFVL